MAEEEWTIINRLMCSMLAVGKQWLRGVEMMKGALLHEWSGRASLESGLGGWGAPRVSWGMVFLRDEDPWCA